MFATPGWTITAKVKSDAGLPSAPSTETKTAQNVNGGDDKPEGSKSANTETAKTATNVPVAELKKKNRKRKRGGKGDEGATEVTAENVVDLYESLMNKPPKKTNGKEGAPPNKKQKNQKNQKQKNATSAGDDKDQDQSEKLQQDPEQIQKQSSEQVPANAKKNKNKNKNKNNDKQQQSQSAQPESTARETKAQQSTQQPQPQAPLLPLPTPAQKLTPLQAAMRAKLIPARFRHLNETLYTRPSEQALELFEKTPELFEEYHAGFRQQVEVWPENPVDCFLQSILQRAAVKSPSTFPSRKDQRRKPPHQRSHEEEAKSGDATALDGPLPRTKGTCTIADMGCGDARLAQTLTTLKNADQLRLKVHSFDLYSPHPLVTRADIANVPLADSSTDLVIFCLALMGTNWMDFIDEAFRILRWKGELWIAEIKSRFGRVYANQNKGNANTSGGGVVSHSVGYRRKEAAAGNNNKKKNKKNGKNGKNEDEELDPEVAGQALAVEVDGEEDRRQETDVSAFVAALKSHGFVLEGTPDLTNKMFVRMHFKKVITPVRGKYKSVEKVRADREKERKKTKWLARDDDDEEDTLANGDLETGDDDGEDENTLLKPCLYKQR